MLSSRPSSRVGVLAYLRIYLSIYLSIYQSVTCGLGKQGKRRLLNKISDKIRILFTLRKSHQQKAINDPDHFHY